MSEDGYASISELVATDVDRAKMQAAWDDEEIENLSNSVGTTGAELTIEDMQRAMAEIAATCRANREEAQTKADEAYLRLRMEPLGPVEPRWSVAGLNAYLLDGGRALAMAFEDDCIATFERIAPRSWLKRRDQRAARRVRMARKRRRGWV